MCWKELEPHVEWSKQDDIRLVKEYVATPTIIRRGLLWLYRLSQSSFTDEEEVDWKKMAGSDWPS